MSLVDAIPQTIKQIGLAKGRGALANGQWGVALGDIGNFLGSIPESRRRDRSLAMQEEMNSLRLTQAKRQEAADQALQGAMSNALLPDGTIDQAKLTQGLAGTPAATMVPELLQHLNQMQESAMHLHAATVSAAEAEDDSLGSIAYAASKVDDPHDKAGILAAGLASGIKQGTIHKDTANTVLASILQDDGNPDPDRVNQAISTILAKSKSQRVLAASDAQKEAAAESAHALAEKRQYDEKQAKQQDALTNFAKQLAATNSQARYAAVYNGIPPEYRNYFDSPDEWTKDSADRAGYALMSPAERIRLQSEERIARNSDRIFNETTRYHNAELDIQREREKRLRDNEGGEGTSGKKDTADYKEFVSQYDKARTEERERLPMVYDQASQQMVDEAKAKGLKPPADYMLTKVKGEPPAYQPPPAFEKWKAMSTSERAGVIRDPNARITDAELAKRVGGGSDHTGRTNDQRADGSAKGQGFLGPLVAPGNKVATEISMGTEDVIPGREMEIPLLVPTLTEAEVKYLLSAPQGDWKNPTMKRIAAKAVDFARGRVATGKPVFAQPGEENTSLLPNLKRGTYTPQPPTSAAPAAAAPAPAAPSKWKVGDAVMYQGKPMVVSGINPDGSVRVKAP